MDKARRSPKDIERHYFNLFRKAYKLPEGRVLDSDRQEKPDIVIAGQQKLGIEIVRFFLRPGADFASEQRQRPLRDGVAAEAQRIYRTAGGKEIEISLGFDLAVPIAPRRRNGLAQKLAAFIQKIDGRPTGMVDRRLYQELMPELETIYLNARKYPDSVWRVMQLHTVGSMVAADLEAIVREKEAKAATYEPCDAYWLLVVVDAMDPAQDQEIQLDGVRIASLIFKRILVFKPQFLQVVAL